MRFVVTALHFLLGLFFWASVVHGQGVDAVPGEYIVRMKSENTGDVHSKLQGKAFLKGAFSAKATYHLTDVDPALVAELQADPDVLYVEPNFRLQTIEGETQGQPISPSDMAALSVGYYDQTAAPVRATQAWSASSAYSSTNRPIVAIIDTGLDKNHNVFSSTNALWRNAGEIAGNGIDDDFNGYVDDVNGWNFVSGNSNFADDENHGTHVAGIVLGATQDILNTPLQPAKIRLMPLKFLDANGSGTTSSAISAIYYAVNMGAKVVNCSWGGGSYSRSLHDAMAYAYSRGVLVVTAAGNYTSNNDATPMYPANYDSPSNISVAASADNDRIASFSNYGASSVHIASPGVYVYSTLPGGYFTSLSGTSMAAPFVAGSAALALREATQLSGYQLRNLAVSTANPVSYLTGKVSSGARINLENMVNTAKSMISAVAYQPAYSPMYQAERSVASVQQGAGGCGMVSAIGGAGAASGLGSGGMGGGASGGAVAVLFLLPVLVWFAFRRRNPVNQRRFERYSLKSDLVIKSGGRELVGTLSTISMGGVSFNVDEALEKGGSIEMKIIGPDGKALDVEGRVVWSERNQAYGVQFDSVRDQARSMLFGWTKQLARQKQ